MGVNQVLGYRAREFMTAKAFVEFWLEEEPGADPYDVVQLLAQLVEAERTCIHRPDFNRLHDFWNEKQGAIRNKLRKDALALLPAIVAKRNGIDELESVPLARDALVIAFEKINIRGPRFLYPPSPTDDARQSSPKTATDSQPSNLAGHDAGDRKYEYPEDFSWIRWWGVQYTFSPKQAFVIELLFREFEAKRPGLTIRMVEDEVEERFGTRRRATFRLRDLFKDSARGVHPAWGTLIKSVGKGRYALCPPVEAE
jgi:hypothetical protein